MSSLKKMLILFPIIFYANSIAASLLSGIDADVDFKLNLLPPTCILDVSEKSVQLGILNAGDTKKYSALNFKLTCDVAVPTAMSATVLSGEISRNGLAMNLINNANQISGVSLELIDPLSSSNINLSGNIQDKSTLFCRQSSNQGWCELIPKVKVSNITLTGKVSGAVSFSIIYV